MMSAVKWDIIADSKPFFQYSHPKMIPAMPFRIIACATMKSVIETRADVEGRCNKPKIIDDVTIAVQAVSDRRSPSLTLLILEKSHTSKLIKNNLFIISSLIAP